MRLLMVLITSPRVYTVCSFYIPSQTFCVGPIISALQHNTRREERNEDSEEEEGDVQRDREEGQNEEGQNEEDSSSSERYETLQNMTPQQSWADFEKYVL